MIKYCFSDETVAKSWLKIHRDPQSTIIAYLNITFNTRRNDVSIFQKKIDEFLSSWPIFKDEKGHIYVSNIFYQIFLSGNS